MSTSFNSGSGVKTSLFTKIHQMESLSEELEKVLLMPRSHQEAWVEKYDRLLQNMLEKYLDDPIMILDEGQTDHQVLDLSMEYVKALRNVMYQVRSISHQT